MRNAILAAAGLLAVAGRADAAFLSFTNSPSNNSVNWNTAVTGLGGTVNTNVNFNTNPVGTLNSSLYTVSDGVTLTAVGDNTQVAFGFGPTDGNTTTGPLSSGEGLHAESNYLRDGFLASTLTISFAAPVYGAGLFTIDLFSPEAGPELLTLEAYTGVNGTGTLLGTASSVNFNFQNNNLYFMGVASTAGDIRSVVFRDFNGGTGDTIGIDDIRFAPSGNGPNPNAVPLPGGLLLGLLGAGSCGVGGLARRRAAAGKTAAA